MKRMSRCLLLALTFLGNVSAGTMSSLAIGNIPPYMPDNMKGGQCLSSAYDYLDYDNACDDCNSNNVPTSQPKNAKSSSKPQQPCATLPGVVNNVNPPATTDTSSASDSKKPVIPVNTSTSGKISSKAKADVVANYVSTVTPVPHSVERQSSVPLRESHTSVATAVPVASTPSVSTVSGAQKQSSIASEESLLVNASYLAAWKKAVRAWEFLNKGARFGGPHSAYFDLTCLPTYDDVKTETKNLCQLFGLPMPSDGDLMSNYKNAMLPLVLVNDHLESVLANLYNFRSQGKEIDLTAVLADSSKFVNRMLLSANDSPSSTESKVKIMTSNSPEAIDISSLNKTDIQLATDLFGNRIANVVTSKNNDDDNAKYMIKKLSNESSKANA